LAAFWNSEPKFLELPTKKTLAIYKSIVGIRQTCKVEPSITNHKSIKCQQQRTLAICKPIGKIRQIYKVEPPFTNHKPSAIYSIRWDSRGLEGRFRPVPAPAPAGLKERRG